MANRLIRPIRIEGNVAFVPLSRGHFAIIDAADVPLIEGRTWMSKQSRHTFYATRAERQDGKIVEIKMHAQLMKPREGAVVDHIDGNGLDNRRANLRIATQAENRRNRRINKNNRSGCKGAYWNPKRNKWVSKIVYNRQEYYLGMFLRLEDAAAAYSEASAKYHGEFGNTGTIRSATQTAHKPLDT